MVPIVRKKSFLNYLRNIVILFGHVVNDTPNDFPSYSQSGLIHEKLDLSLTRDLRQNHLHVYADFCCQSHFIFFSAKLKGLKNDSRTVFARNEFYDIRKYKLQDIGYDTNLLTLSKLEDNFLDDVTGIVVVHVFRQIMDKMTSYQELLVKVAQS